MAPLPVGKVGAALAILLSAGGAHAGIRQFSYDPADAETRAVTGPVTLVIDQRMFGARVMQMRATEAKATTDLARADIGGRDGVSRALGADARERQLYRVLPADDGGAFIDALCPGSKRAWLALSPVRYGEALHAKVVGDDPAGGPVKLCHSLDFAFHGEWSVPAGSQLRIDPVAPPDFPN